MTWWEWLAAWASSGALVGLGVHLQSRDDPWHWWQAVAFFAPFGPTPLFGIFVDWVLP